jgi:hypothetical protein
MTKLHATLLAAGLSISFLAASGLTPAAAQIGVGLSVQVEPPALMVETQPPMPAEGYLWTPGYWAYSNAAYVWAPGVWLQPPQIGFLWTPPYWGWANGLYLFHGGYWGSHVGFYGGVNYGFGYGGNGYAGGRWEGGHFSYNRTVNNLGSVHVSHVYEHNVTNINRSTTSYSGGPHGVHANEGSRAESPAATRPAAESRAAESRSTGTAAHAAVATPASRSRPAAYASHHIAGHSQAAAHGPSRGAAPRGGGGHAKPHG